MVSHVIVCSNIIEKDQKFLLVKETKMEARNKYNFPSGKLEGNEDIFQAAIREAKEETGTSIKIDKLVGVYQRPLAMDGNNITIIVFKSSIVNGNPVASDEHPEVKFFSYNEILELAKQKRLKSKYMLPALEDYTNGKCSDVSSIKILR